jgi:hypothetical protein
LGGLLAPPPDVQRLLGVAHSRPKSFLFKERIHVDLSAKKRSKVKSTCCNMFPLLCQYVGGSPMRLFCCGRGLTHSNFELSCMKKVRVQEPDLLPSAIEPWWVSQDSSCCITSCPSNAGHKLEIQFAAPPPPMNLRVQYTQPRFRNVALPACKPASLTKVQHLCIVAIKDFLSLASLMSSS